MEPVYKIESDGSISITVKIKPEGTYYEQEEQIAEAVSEVGRLASQLLLKQHDTTGAPIIIENRKYTSKGESKKKYRPPGAQ